VLELEEGFVAPEPEVDVFPLFVVLPAPEAPELLVPAPPVVVLDVAPPVVAPPVVVPMVELFMFLPVTEVVPPVVAPPVVAPPVVVLLAAPPVAFPLLELVSPAPLEDVLPVLLVSLSAAKRLEPITSPVARISDANLVFICCRSPSYFSADLMK